jgi:hypothetical protein
MRFALLVAAAAPHVIMLLDFGKVQQQLWQQRAVQGQYQQQHPSVTHLAVQAVVCLLSH